MWICDETGWLNTVTGEYVDYENYGLVLRILNRINGSVEDFISYVNEDSSYYLLEPNPTATIGLQL